MGTGGATRTPTHVGIYLSTRGLLQAGITGSMGTSDPVGRGRQMSNPNPYLGLPLPVTRVGYPYQCRCLPATHQH